MNRKRRARLTCQWSLIPQLSELLFNLLRSKDHFICQQGNSAECVGSDYQCSPQCNLRGGPHFPSKRHEKFKEFMRTLSLAGKRASWSAMLAQSLADARRRGVACFLVPLLVQSCSPCVRPAAVRGGGEAPGHCSYPSPPSHLS